MKISNEHYEKLKSAIENSDVDLDKSIKMYEEIGHSKQRFYWDIFWASGYHKDLEFRSASYNDSHIETAVKKAVSELLKK